MYLLLIITIVCLNGILGMPFYINYFTLYGQVIYPSGSQISIEPNSLLITELQDISVLDDLATTISRQITSAVVFPIIFNISYSSDQIILGHLHVLNAKIINENDEILYANDKRIEVKLLGSGRTTFADIPVAPVEYRHSLPKIKLLEWPHLVGMKGTDAVDLIKEETGYKNVFVVTNETSVTKDLRYDRVCVYVDDDGRVTHVPRTG